MENSLIESMAREYGFLGAYFIEPKRYEIMENDAKLVLDARDVCEWVKCVMLLVYPYNPFARDEIIPAYYLASNVSYHATQKLITNLASNGVRAQNVNLPAKTVLTDANIGYKGRNGLVRIGEYGSRIVLYTLALDTCKPQEYNIKNAPCGKCTACKKVCPGGAIDEYCDKYKCIRWYMEDELYPQFVSENVNMYLGCDRCMAVCPHNAKIPFGAPEEEEREAFEPDRILSGDVSAARTLVGKNISENRLMKDAALLKKRIEMQTLSAL